MSKIKIKDKYQKTYYMPPENAYDWVKKDTITAPPIWCSVDLRDGNQALIDPMSLETKLEFFKVLVDVGFKEIEVGFPASSDTEFEFIRALIDKNMIPDDVTIQVLTQAREHIIRKTFEAVKGAPKAIVHLYNSTSVEQREQVFKKEKSEIIKIAVDGAQLLKKLADETEGNFMFEYSPESFSQTEPEFALEVCNAVLDVWKPTPEHKAIINLPSTVQVAMPHVFACQIEYMSKNMKYRDGVVLSVHPHNDRGTGVGDAELGVLAGADRVEGTLFGNGERTGNVDLVTVAMNMVTHGVDSGLDFSDIMDIRKKYEEYTNMRVHERTPYAGDLVFTAFSGSHQDAISKGMNWRNEGKTGVRWDIPYLPIDPSDLGREYESDVIRINSTSGKGGVAFVLKQQFGLSLPAAMKEEVGYLIKGVSDRRHSEIQPAEVYSIFEEQYVNPRGIFAIPECHFKQVEGGIEATVTIEHKDKRMEVACMGNGRLDAVSNAIKTFLGINYEVRTYEEHAVSRTSSSKAAAYFGLNVKDATGEKVYWGVGIDEDIIKASIAALTAAVNRIAADQHIRSGREERLVEVLSYIQRNYAEVTLEELADNFHLSPPYLSKYIKEKSGLTFQDAVRNERMKRACTLLRESNPDGSPRSVESVSADVGYENVEHFNRLFKKTYGVTPVQYRKAKS